MEQPEISWDKLKTYLKKNTGKPLKLAVFLIIMELVLVYVLPVIMPETWYLGHYLPAGAVIQTRRFLNNRMDLEPDPVLGWHNRPSGSYRNIKYDRYGSRSARGIAEGQRKKHRVIFFGDSRANGYTAVTNEETINAFMENDTVETLNFGSALYSLDQSFLAMQATLPRFDPDAVVIALGSETEQLLDAQYIPFVLRRGYGMPYLKPRYVLENGKLVCLKPPPSDLLKNVPDVPELLAYLKTHDGYYPKFREFQRLESTPLLTLLSSVQAKFSEWQTDFYGRTGQESRQSLRNPELLRALVQAIRKTAEERNIRLCFMMMPTLEEFLGQRNSLYDQVLRLLYEEKILVVDVRGILQGHRVREKLFEDDVHISGAANRLIADSISRILFSEQKDRTVIIR